MEYINLNENDLICIKDFEEFNIFELYDILKSRQDIFVVEQKSPYNDIDDLDKICKHMIYYSNGEFAGYMRLIPRYDSREYSSMGRFNVPKKFRGKGIGGKIFLESVRYIFENFEDEKIEIDAETYLTEPYERFGFKKISEAYILDGVSHTRMEISKKLFSEKYL